MKMCIDWQIKKSKQLIISNTSILCFFKWNFPILIWIEFCHFSQTSVQVEKRQRGVEKEESEGETAILPIDTSPSKNPTYSQNVCARNHQAVEKGAEGGRRAIDATGSRETKIGGEYYERMMWRCIGKVVLPTRILEEAARDATLLKGSEGNAFS